MAIYLGLSFAALSAVCPAAPVQKPAFSIDAPGCATIVCLILLQGEEREHED